MNALAVALTVFAVRAFLGKPMLIRGHSMKPTLRDHDLVWVDVLSIRCRAPQLGDLVVYRDAELGPMVKRVMGLPGDTVEVRDGIVVRNGATAAVRRLGRVSNWEDAGQVLPLRNLHAERLEESIGGAHVIQRFAPSGSSPPVHVPDGRVFVLGDNRDDSKDSRQRGTVPIDDVAGRVIRAQM